MGKDKEEPKKSSKEKRQEKARLKAGAVAKKDKSDEVDEVAEVGCPARERACDGWRGGNAALTRSE